MATAGNSITPPRKGFPSCHASPKPLREGEGGAGVTEKGCYKKPTNWKPTSKSPLHPGLSLKSRYGMISLRSLLPRRRLSDILIKV